MRRHTIAWVAVACTITACTYDKQPVQVQPSEVEVHAVLDPGVLPQAVLVERSLNGTQEVHTRRFDSLDPINTGGGIPVSGANVSITGPDGTFQGTEVHYGGKAASYGAGRYVIPLPAAAAIKQGAHYTLRVVTLDGKTVTGSTTVPRAAAIEPSKVLAPFDRNTDTLRLSWNTAHSMRTYGVSIDTPYGAFFLFTDTTSMVLPGSLRNLFASNLVRTFIPGFRQSVTIYAADTNYYDYYRTQNDPFTGSGVINRLTGGVGLFGALLVMDGQMLDVTQRITEPSFEGDYDVPQVPSAARTYVDVLHLYVETPGEPSSLSGWYMRDRTSGVKAGLDGTRTDGHITITLMQAQHGNEALAVFTGQQVGDSLIGTYNNVIGRVVLLRRKTP
ncbi:MAG: DUF4249 family protein [bacterium]